MRTLAYIGLFGLGLSGCVVYEHDRSGVYDEGYDNYDDSPAEDTAALDDGSDDEPPAVELTFFPAEVEQGESVLGYLTVSEGELDLSSIQNLTFYGDLELLAFDIRADEVIVSLQVSKEADPGPVDLLVELPDNNVILLEGAVTIYAVGEAPDEDPAEDTGDGGEDSDAPAGGEDTDNCD